MPGPLHEPHPDEPDHDPDDPGRARRTSRGLVLFAVYLLLYGTFVLLNAFRPDAMEATPILGINLAVLYGMSLIAAAFLFALVYAWLARRRAGDRPR